MPITRGIQCAYCNTMLDDDYTMDIHLRQHQKHIDETRQNREDYKNRKRF